MSSSRECLERVVGSQTTPRGKRVHVAVLCVEWPGDDAYQLLDKPGVMATALAPHVAGSLEHILVSAILAYESRSRGRGIARKPGIDLLLHLLGERNIRKAVEKAKPDNKAIVVAVSESREALQELLSSIGGMRPTQCCLDCAETVRRVHGLELPPGIACRYLVTRTAVFAATQRL